MDRDDALTAISFASALSALLLSRHGQQGNPGPPGTPGSSGVVAPLGNLFPQDVGTVSPGGSTSASREDHIHAHGLQPAGSYHAIASASQDGFMDAAMARYVLLNLTAPQNLIGPGAANLTTPYTRLTTVGVGDAITLAAGSFQGQRKDLLAFAGYVAGQTSVISPVGFTGPATSISLSFVGQRVTLAWDFAAVGWDLISWSGEVVFI